MKKKIKIGMIFAVVCVLTMGMSVFAADTMMKNKKWVSGQGGAYVDANKDGKIDSFQSSGTSYYKIQIAKQGYITVDVKTSPLPGEKEYSGGQENAYTKLSLLNAKKKRLAEYNNHLIFQDKYENSMVFTAAVKKGTYYIAAEGTQKYKMRYRFTPVSKINKAVKDPAKAPALKKGKTVKGLLAIRETDYYKIKLTKKTKVTLSFQAQVRDSQQKGLLDGLNAQLLIKKGNSYLAVDDKGKVTSKDNPFYWDHIIGKDKITATLPKGTYYVLVFAWGDLSGYYTMKWQ